MAKRKLQPTKLSLANWQALSIYEKAKPANLKIISVPDKEIRRTIT